MVEENPCLAHNCDLCCRDTIMPLSKKDIQVIQGLGKRGFYIYKEGERRLRNVDGRCIFLIGGRCEIYENRPEGCRLYPLVIYEEGDRAGFDVDCPHRDEFSYTEKDVLKLRSLLDRITEKK